MKRRFALSRMALYVAIISAGIFIYQISGGFPPRAWMIGYQIVSSGALSAFPFGSLLLLGMQLLSLALAWGILIWMALYDIISQLVTLPFMQYILFPSDKNGYKLYPQIIRKKTISSSLQIPSQSASKQTTAADLLKVARADDALPRTSEALKLVPASTNLGPANLSSLLAEAGPDTPGSEARRVIPGEGASKVLQTVVPPETGDQQREAASTQVVAESARMHIPPQVHAVTHPGKARAHKPNEDTSLCFSTLREAEEEAPQWVGLFLVADGMGGHQQGKYASSFVVNTILTGMEPLLLNPSYQSEDLRQHFISIVKRANTALFQQNESARVFRGTTLTGVVLLEEPGYASSPGDPLVYTAHVVNIGDSRVYHHSQSGGVIRITRDHSIVENLVEKGVITDKERYTHEQRNEIYRSMGSCKEIEVDTFTLALHASDRLLLCSDGLWEMVRDNQLALLLAKPGDEPSSITHQLLQAALLHGGLDNITMIVISMPEEQESREEQHALLQTWSFG